MDESNSQPEKPKGQRRFSQEQYDMLIRCSDKKDMTEWNEWRRANSDEDVILEGADLGLLHLKGAHLNGRALYDGRTGKLIKWKSRVCLKNAHLESAILDNAELSNVELDGARLRKASLRAATLHGSSLKSADLWGADMEGADLRTSNLQCARLRGTNLKGAILRKADLKGACFELAIVDGFTLFRRCLIDEYTDFRGVGLVGARVDVSTRQLLEYNSRRMNWKAWYTWRDWHLDEPQNKRSTVSRALHHAVHVFWWMSDYGRSTGRIVFSFFVLALFFATIYSNLAYWFPPGIVSNLEVEPHLPIWHYFLLLLLRPIYFSVVTMTTLGFGDMYASVQSIWGHILLTLQVILGYVLLGALVTRFAVLFTAGGPAGKFADDKEEKATEGTENL